MREFGRCIGHLNIRIFDFPTPQFPIFSLNLLNLFIGDLCLTKCLQLINPSIADAIRELFLLAPEDFIRQEWVFLPKSSNIECYFYQFPFVFTYMPLKR